MALSSLPPAGVALAIAGSVFLGLVPSGAHLAYEAGASPAAFMLTRCLCVVVLVGGYLFIRRRPAFPGRWRRSLGVGLMITSAGLFYMASVRFLPVALASLLFFTFPIGIAALTRLVHKQPVTAIRLGGIVVALIGLGMVLGVSEIAPDPFGVVLALLGAASAAGCIFCGEFVVPETGALPINFQGGLAGLLIFLPLFLTGHIDWPETSSGWTALAVSHLGFILGVTCLFLAIPMIGAVIAATVGYLEPITSVLASVVLLSQGLGPWQVAGIIVTLGAVFSVTLGGVSRRGNLP